MDIKIPTDNLPVKMPVFSLSTVQLLAVLVACPDRDDRPIDQAGTHEELVGLRREKVDYVVIGAFALTVLGVVRATTDVDALLFTKPGRLPKLAKPFERAGFLTELRTAEPDDPVSGMLVLSDDFDNRVKLLGGLRNMDPEIFSRALEVRFRNETLRIVGREDFIAMKCFAGGPQDLLDARSAYQAAPGPIDLDLLRTVTRRFGREAADRLEGTLAD